MYSHNLGWQWHCAAVIEAQICQRAREAPRTRSKRPSSDHQRFPGGSPIIVVSKPAAKLKPMCQKASISQKQTSKTDHTVFPHSRILHLLGGVILTTLRLPEALLGRWRRFPAVRQSPARRGCRPGGPALGRFGRPRTSTQRSLRWAGTGARSKYTHAELRFPRPAPNRTGCPATASEKGSAIALFPRVLA